MLEERRVRELLDPLQHHLLQQQQQQLLQQQHHRESREHRQHHHRGDRDHHHHRDHRGERGDHHHQGHHRGEREHHGSHRAERDRVTDHHHQLLQAAAAAAQAHHGKLTLPHLPPDQHLLQQQIQQHLQQAVQQQQQMEQRHQRQQEQQLREREREQQRQRQQERQERQEREQHHREREREREHRERERQQHLLLQQQRELQQQQKQLQREQQQREQLLEQQKQLQQLEEEVLQQGQTQEERKQFEVGGALPKGWVREEIVRKTGLSAGKIDVCYHSPNGKKFWSKPQLSRFLGDSVDLSTFDFRTGKVNNLLLRKNKKHRPQTDYSRGARSDSSLMPPIRQTASIFKQPVTVHKTQKLSTVKVDFKHGHQEKPKQLFWEKRLEGLRACDVSGVPLDALDLPKGVEPVGPNIRPDTVLQSVATALHCNGQPITGQTMPRPNLETNPGVYINPDQPLIQVVNVREDDIRSQEERVLLARKKLEDALKAYDLS